MCRSSLTAVQTNPQSHRTWLSKKVSKCEALAKKYTNFPSPHNSPAKK